MYWRYAITGAVRIASQRGSDASVSMATNAFLSTSHLLKGLGELTQQLGMIGSIIFLNRSSENWGREGDSMATCYRKSMLCI